MRGAVVAFPIAVLAALFGLVGAAPGHAATPTFQRTDLSAPLTASAPSNPVSIAVANLDGVNGPDIVLGLYDAATATSQVGVLLNDGHGHFTSMTRYPTCAGASYLHTVDLNHDGNQDVVGGCSSGNVVKMLGNGHGALGPATLVSCCGDALAGPVPVVPAVLTPGTSPVLVFPSSPDYPNYHLHICFAFPTDSPTTVPTCDNPGYAAPAFMGGPPLAVASLLTPGYADIITPSATNPDGITIFARNSATNYRSWADDDDNAGGKVRSLLAADVSGDGKPDIAIGHGDSTHGSISVLIQNAGGIPDNPTSTFPTTTDPQALGVGDFDGDGHPDLVAASGYGTLAFHHGNGDGSFAPFQPIPLLGYGNPAYATSVTMAVADFNGDGKPDIAVADSLGRTLEILLNTTPNSAPPPVASGLKISPDAFTAAASGPSATAAHHQHAHPKPGAAVSYALTIAARVNFTVDQLLPGRTQGSGAAKHCVAQTKHNRTSRRCTRVIGLRGSFNRVGAAGANSFHFTGRLDGHKLKPGSYLLTGTPSAAGKIGHDVSDGFRILS